jgi:CRISPR/Cas system Type II protein with McrA/HNH and RuvC-like nuclease domain
MSSELNFNIIYCESNFSKEYLKTLFQSTIISELVYEKDPNKALESNEYKYLNHGIRSLCVSKTIDDEENKDSNLDVKYMICDCSDDRQKINNWISRYKLFSRFFGRS